MSGRSAGPPRLAEWMLGLVLDSAWREAVLGDLYEEHARRAASGGPHRAWIWYWTHALRLTARFGLAAAARRGRRSRQATIPSPAGDSLVRTLGIEIRHALRSIRKRPAMTAVVVLTLALGLGANAAIFAMIDALVLRPFTFADIDRIVMVAQMRDGDLDRQESVSPADFLDFKRRADVFERVAAIDWWEANLVGRDEPEAVLGFKVSADFFPALGVQPTLGRWLLPEEETVGRHQRVVLGHGLWQRRFAGDRSIIGETIQIDATPYEVVGVAPAGFDFPNGAELWAPLAFDARTAVRRDARWLTVIGRLSQGRTLDDAKAQVAVIFSRLAEEHPETNRGFDGEALTLTQGMLDVGLPPILSLWQASAAFVLLIACANVANLMIARGAERQREIAVRLAIGASRMRLVRELLIESTLVSLLAVPAALGIAWISLELLEGAMPARLIRFVAGWHAIDVDARLFAFTAALAVGTALVFGLVPALQATRPRLAETLKEGGRSATAGGSRMRLRRTLVVAEMALALPLLVASALSAISVDRFLNGPQGYDQNGVLTMRMTLPEARYGDAAARRRFAESIVDRVGQVPAVDAAAVANVIPAMGGNSSTTIEIDGKPNPDRANPPRADYRVATPRFFDVLRIPVLQGRAFTTGDRDDTQPVAIVSQSFAERYWPGEDAVGRRFRTDADGPWLTVVGVASDVIHNWFARRHAPTVYRPLAQAPTGRLSLVVRTGQSPTAIAPDVRRAIAGVDPQQPVYDVMSLSELLKERTIGLQFMAWIMLAFGGIALLLAVVGVYGVMAFLVTQRTHEIGVRMALGATRRDVLRMSVGQAGRLTAIGVAAGIALSLALGRLIEAGLLVATSDFRVTLGLAIILVIAALAAGYLPARRASSIDPIVALRVE